MEELELISFCAVCQEPLLEEEVAVKCNTCDAPFCSRHEHALNCYVGCAYAQIKECNSCFIRCPVFCHKRDECDCGNSYHT